MNYILIFAGVVIGVILVLYLIGKFDPEIKAQKADFDSKSKAQSDDVVDEILTEFETKTKKEQLKRLQAVKEKKEIKKKVSKSKKHVITEENKPWIKVVDMRVQAMPMDFIKQLGYTIDSLGHDHFQEYKNNEFRVPKEDREEVALGRLQGLKSIRDYIQTKGTNAQKFHLDASIKGAALYASSLGIDID